MIDFVFYNNTTDRQWKEPFFKDIFSKAESEEELKLDSDKKYELSLHLVGEGKIKEMNWKYRGKNKITDVLSFPIQNKVHGLQTQNNDIMELGDIFICLPFAKKTARKEKTDTKEKVAFLTVHGFLHLLGFDHEKSPAEAKKMFKLQDKIMQKIK